jgi:hypothetical protein
MFYIKGIRRRHTLGKATCMCVCVCVCACARAELSVLLQLLKQSERKNICQQLEDEKEK